MDDQMMTPSLHGNRAPTPLCGKHQQYISSICNAEPAIKEILNSVTLGNPLVSDYRCTSSFR